MTPFTLSAWVLHFADYFFVVLHTCLICFNLFGWVIRPLRKANLVLLVITGGSWFFLGIFFGIGYCPLTDWHWQILYKLGLRNLPDSYISYLIGRLTGFTANATFVEALTVIFYFLALAMSVYVNFFLKRAGQR
jgi:hypothetical protein